MVDTKRWTPFQRATYTQNDLIKIAERLRDFGKSYDEIGTLLADMAQDEVWVNNRYQVAVRRQEPEGAPALVHLSIKRRDKEQIRDGWRDFQRIKNELVGPECEAVELYPAESRKVDSANQYHLWVIEDPDFRWPFGFGQRFVTDDSFHNAKQTPLEDKEAEA